MGVIYMQHKFTDSLKVGEVGEKVLDGYFSNKFDIEDVEMVDQRRGIDRRYTHKESGAVCTVEYKTDVRAADTGNVFIEIWSNKQNKKKGWAYTSQAQWLYFYIPGTNKVYISEMTRVKMKLKDWASDYRKVGVRNKSGNSYYTTEGIPVPIKDFEDICFDVIDIGACKSNESS